MSSGCESLIPQRIVWILDYQIAYHYLIRGLVECRTDISLSSKRSSVCFFLLSRPMAWPLPIWWSSRWRLPKISTDIFQWGKVPWCRNPIVWMAKAMTWVLVPTMGNGVDWRTVGICYSVGRVGLSLLVWTASNIQLLSPFWIVIRPLSGFHIPFHEFPLEHIPLRLASGI